MHENDANYLFILRCIRPEKNVNYAKLKNPYFVAVLGQKTLDFLHCSHLKLICCQQAHNVLRPKLHDI